MQDQDVQLDVLSQAIDRQKQVGILITDELESQIDLLQDTEEQVNYAANSTRNHLLILFYCGGGGRDDDEYIQVDRTQSRLAATSRRLDTFFKDQGFDMRGTG